MSNDSPFRHTHRLSAPTYLGHDFCQPNLLTSLPISRSRTAAIAARRKTDRSRSARVCAMRRRAARWIRTTASITFYKVRGGRKTDQNRPFGEQPIHRRDYVLR